MTLPRILLLGTVITILLFAVASACFLDGPIILYLHAKLPTEATEIAAVIGILAEPEPYFVGFVLFYIVIRPIGRDRLTLIARCFFFSPSPSQT